MYQCWGEDKEDLTERVEVAIAAAKGRDTVVFGLTSIVRRAKSEPRDPRVVMVVCKKGHENVFEVDR